MTADGRGGGVRSLPPSGTNKVTLNQFGSRRLDLKDTQIGIMR